MQKDKSFFGFIGLGMYVGFYIGAHVQGIGLKV